MTGDTSRTAIALAAASGVLAGVLVTLALGAAPTATPETVTVTRPLTSTGSVIVRTVVPPLVGERLDTALERLERARFDADVEGGGVFGVVDESNWRVAAQAPAPGTMLEQGSSVRLQVERR